MDPIVIGAGLQAAGSVFGGLLGKSGARAANRANLQIARENREWQEMMSNTAYQRARKDMEAANLNPVLSLGRPASTPAGNIAQMQNENVQLSEATAKAFMAARNSLELRNLRAQATATEQQASKTRAEANYIQSQDAVSQIQALIGSNTADLQQLDKEIKALQIPGIRAEADFWTWLQSAGADEAAKALGRAGPLLQRVLPFLFRGKGKPTLKGK